MTLSLSSFGPDTKKGTRLSMNSLCFVVALSFFLVYSAYMAQGSDFVGGISQKAGIPQLYHDHHAAAAQQIDKSLIQYQIDGGMIEAIQAEEGFATLRLSIKPTDDSGGELSISLPRSLIDAKLNGADDDFFVFVEGQEVIADETSTTEKKRTLVIPFEKDTTSVEIVGTQMSVSSFIAGATTQQKQEEKEDATGQQQEEGEIGGGCLIATASFGSELAPEVQMLREVRDNKVLSTESGKRFMDQFNSFYYSFSPTVAQWERDSPVFREMVKGAITPLVYSLGILKHAEIDSEADILAYGIGVISLNVGMYFVMPGVVIHKVMHRRSKNH